MPISKGNRARKRNRRPTKETAHRMRAESASDPTGHATYKWVDSHNDLLFRIDGNAIIRRWGRGKAITAFILHKRKRLKRVPLDCQIDNWVCDGTFANWVDKQTLLVIRVVPKRIKVSRKPTEWKEAGNKHRVTMAECTEIFKHDRERAKIEIRVREILKNR